MKTAEELPEPVGNFILDNAEGHPTPNGTFYHYRDVCRLLKLFANAKSKAILENLELYKNATSENPNEEYHDWQYDKDVDYLLSLIPKDTTKD